jgi:hypothetical protein
MARTRERESAAAARGWELERQQLAKRIKELQASMLCVLGSRHGAGSPGLDGECMLGRPISTATRPLTPTGALASQMELVQLINAPPPPPVAAQVRACCRLTGGVLWCHGQRVGESWKLCCAGLEGYP